MVHRRGLLEDLVWWPGTRDDDNGAGSSCVQYNGVLAFPTCSLCDWASSVASLSFPVCTLGSAARQWAVVRVYQGAQPQECHQWG
jgi:hypothetical protein